jgi:hypothetical protein
MLSFYSFNSKPYIGIGAYFSIVAVGYAAYTFLTMIELEELEQELRKANAPILKYFRPGLSKSEVNNLFREIDLIPSDELVDLYTWRNGLDYEGVAGGKISFGVNGGFFPLQESVDMYRSFTEKQFPLFFPIFWDDTFLINLDVESVDYGKIFIYSPSLLIIEPQSCYDGLQQMIRTFQTCFQKGIFSYDADGFFHKSYDLCSETSRRLNPLSEYWR